MSFKICKKCLLPSTKPDLTFNSDGICSACFRFNNRKNIDWNERKSDLQNIANEYKSDSNWDCVIPVSGGKDSTFQAITAKNLGLNPLLVSSNTCDIMVCLSDSTASRTGRVTTWNDFDKGELRMAKELHEGEFRNEIMKLRREKERLIRTFDTGSPG